MEKKNKKWKKQNWKSLSRERESERGGLNVCVGRKEKEEGDSPLPSPPYLVSVITLNVEPIGHQTNHTQGGTNHSLSVW